MKLNLGILGLGTVGSGVIDIIESRAEWLKKHYSIELEIKVVCARSQETLNKFSRFETTTDPQELLSDTDVDIVLELVGGYDLPLEWLRTAIENGKHVVTANKALIAKHGDELFPLAAKKKLDIRFEAAVAGGIPIIQAMQTSLNGNEILSMYGIINGTCNYIVHEMEEKALPFDVALKDAQEKGYAEADPTFDIEGIDACHKLAILSSLACRKYVDFNRIPTEGISKITATDLENIHEMGCTIKLLGVYKKANDKIEVGVHPCILPKDHLLANVNGVLNAVYVETDRLGPALFTGAGAGMYPTASAVVGDVFDLAISLKSGQVEPVSLAYYSKETPASILGTEAIEAKYYLRIVTEDRKGALAHITHSLSEHNVSLESVVQRPPKEGCEATIIAVTHLCSESDLKIAMQEVENLSEVKGECQYFRFLES